MHRVAISSTGLFTPPEVITNEELVAAFNAYAAIENEKYAAEIAAAGANVLVAGSAVFGDGRTIAENIAAFRNSLAG